MLCSARTLNLIQSKFQWRKCQKNQLSKYIHGGSHVYEKKSCMLREASELLFQSENLKI